MTESSTYGSKRQWFASDGISDDLIVDLATDHPLALGRVECTGHHWFTLVQPHGLDGCWTSLFDACHTMLR